VSPAVFHSDTTEHHRATSRHQKADNQPTKQAARQQRQPSKQTRQRTDGSQGAAQPRQQRPKTSAQREAALIDLVDKQ
jgi:hypothetical protein